MSSSPRYVAWADPSAVLGTPPTAPLSSALPIATAWLWEVNVRIPPGHAGVTGIALVDSGQYIVPYSDTPAWLIGDDDNLTFPYDKQLGNNVALVYYNSSTLYTHGWQVRLVYTPMSAYVDEAAFIYTPAPADWLASLESLGGEE